MADAPPRRRLDQPRSARRFRVEFDPETFGRLSEKLARFLGTGTFLFWQTLVVIVWITLNLVAVTLRWDPYPFILLNLAFSTQAAYAAPLILLAQNRQDDRDRITLEEDRSRSAQTKADTEFLARELAALRVAIGEVATRDYLRGELERLRDDLDDTPDDPADPSRAAKSAKRRPDKSGKSRGKKPVAAAAAPTLPRTARASAPGEPRSASGGGSAARGATEDEPAPSLPPPDPAATSSPTGEPAGTSSQPGEPAGTDPANGHRVADEGGRE